MIDTDVKTILLKFKKIHWEKLPEEVIEYLNDRFTDSSSIRETWYRILHNIEERPRCKVCGGYVRFNNLTGNEAGFSAYCSQRCKHHNKFIEEQNKYSNKNHIINIERDKQLLEKYSWKQQEKIYPDKEDKEYAFNRFPDADTFKEVLFRLDNNLEERPACQECGCRVRYSSGNFSKYCSKSCVGVSEETKILVKKYTKRKTYIGDINDDIIKEYFKNRVYIHWNKEPENIINYIQNRFTDSTSLSESYYRILNNLEIRPICPICGKSLVFKEQNRYFNKYCSTKCAAISEETKEHRKETNLKLFGYDNPYKSPEVKAKISKTNLELYGAENVFASKIIQERMKETWRKNWGTEYPMQADYWRKFMSIRSSSKEFQEKIYNTMKKNKTFGKSKKEDMIYEMLLKRFPDVKRHYKDFNKYPFYCDFYIPSIDTWIEYQGYWSHGDHPFNPNDKNDIDKLNNMIYKSKNHPSYIGAISVWTNGDPVKRETAKKNNLNYIEFWNIQEVENWLNSI